MGGLDTATVWNPKGMDRMALYHFNAKIVKRSEGRSATQVAAYKLGQPIRCERTGTKFNYTHGSRVTAFGIEAPIGAPDWILDNEKLWNAVELREVRKDAQVLRDFEVALPFEVSAETHARMVKAFAQAIVEEFSVVVGWGIHAPREYTDQRNIVAFLLLTTREVGKEGFTRKVREMSVRPTSIFILERFRKLWADLINKELDTAGLSERVDHRSLKARRSEALEAGDNLEAGLLDREPQARFSAVEHRKLKTELMALEKARRSG